MYTKLNTEKPLKKDNQKQLKIDERLFCRFDRAEAHLFKNPILLPCRNTACIDCLRRYINTEGVLHCTLCNNDHFIKDISELPTDINIEAMLFNNTFAINEVLYSEYRFMVNNFIERYNDRNKLVDDLFDNLQKSLNKRFNEIRVYFEQILKKCMDHLVVLKFNMKDSLNLMNVQVKKKIEDFKDFHNIMGKKLRSNFTNDDDDDDDEVDSDEETDRPLLMLRNCQNKINEVKELSDHFTRILHRVSFEPSDWKPEMLTHVGKLTPLPLTKLANSIKIGQPFVVPIEKHLKDPHSLCVVDSKRIAITDTILKSVFMFDDKYQFICSINGVGNKAFMRPTAICVDDIEDNLYVYDQGAKTLFITDKNIKIVKKEIYEEFIQDLCFFDRNLVILDRVNSTLRICTNSGQVLTVNYLFNKVYSQFESKIVGEWLVKNPVRVDVIMNNIAILDSHSDVYFYDFDIKLKSKINSTGNGNVWSMVFFDNYLFAHSEDGSLTCYEGTVLKNSNEQYYTPSFSRKMNYYLNFSWHMKVFNDHIVILSENIGRKVLVVI